MRRSTVGTLDYMASEILHYLDDVADTSEHTRAVAFWSVGIIVNEMLSGARPFKDRRAPKDFSRSTTPLNPLKLQD